MILYHGSNILIREIDLSMSKVGKDFGCGFYLSSDMAQALELADKKTEQLGFGTPVLNVYDFDESCLAGTDLFVGRYDGYTLEWARFVLIVIGPIANDAVGFQIRRLTSGLIDIDRFMEELKYMKGVTMQYFFGTEKALKYLTRIDEL